MRSFLFVCGVCVALCLCSCSQQPTATPQQMPQLGDGSVRVSVRSVKVTGALSRSDALSGLSEALPHLQHAVKDSATDGKSPRGTFAASFRTEPDGMIRWLGEGESQLTGPGAKGVVEKFTVGTMGHKWRFPQSSGPSLIEAEFTIGEQ
jgi:hypothetical protein